VRPGHIQIDMTAVKEDMALIIHGAYGTASEYKNGLLPVK